ncbi:MAG: porin [Thiohalocapsa sp.]|nr:porin [Thiohalocapsa sp.]MCF7990636.1 porin [Thiohalocapsa sp.]
MNKKLISLAVAAAMTAPAAAMAEATLYGKLNVSIDYQDVTNAIAPTFETTTVTDPVTGESVSGVVLDANGVPVIATEGQDFEGWGVAREGGFMKGAGRANRIGVKGSEDLGNGLKAIYQVEFGINLSAADDNIPSGNNGISMRNSFVGLAGSFGTFLVGRHDTPLKISTGKLDMFSDTMADYNGTVGFDDLRVDNAIGYISPSFSGFSFAAALVAPGGATAGEGLNINSDQLNGAYSLAAIYNNGPFYASAAYEALSNEMFMNSATSLAGDCAVDAATCSYVGDDYTKWRIGLGLLDWNGFTLTAIYEDQSDLAAGQQREALNFIDEDGNIVAMGSSPLGVTDQQLWQVQAGYAFGNNMVKAMYGSVERGDARILGSTRDTISIGNLTDDLAGDKNTWAIGFDHNFSKRTKAYVLYTAVDDDNADNILGSTADWDGFSLGMIHKF